MLTQRCPIHGTAVCPKSEGQALHNDCRECRRAVDRIRRGNTIYRADVELEEALLARALRGVGKSLRHVLNYG